MNRNTESRFALNPTHLDIQRSKFGRNSSYKTSFNVGDVVPFYVDEVLPGDTFNVKTSKVIRMPSLLTPIMDNIYLDTYYFFVPNRLCWEHWKELMGENTQSAWVPSVQYTVPQISAPSGGWDIGTIADYMGLPTGVSNISVSALPFRAYALICDQWFRDQNVQDPVNVPLNDTNIVGVNTGDQITDIVKGGKPFIAAKYHDYFTSVLPGPQKGNDVSLGVAAGTSPVFGSGYGLALAQSTSDSGFIGVIKGNGATQGNIGTLPGATPSGNSGTNTVAAGVPTKQQMDANNYPYSYTGLVADIPALGFTVNELRTAFQLQRLLERDARSGTRYIESIKAHFGVTSPDSRLQRTEYLGGNRIPININQVVQNSGTISGSTPQGNVAGYSVTSDVHSDFVRSFTEHGFVIGVMVARYDHTYQQGIDKFWSRKGRFDYYFPVLANLGEQPVLNKEIFAQGTTVDDEVFGYQEAWADYRYKPSRVTGDMRSSSSKSLDVWHLADNYTSLPSYSAAWVREDKSVLDRVLSVTSAVSHQFYADLYIQNETTRPMPLYSVPGLIDHH